MAIFRFVGLSGPLFVLFLIVSGTAFSPYNGGHWLLWLEWALVLAIWLLARWAEPWYFRHR